MAKTSLLRSSSLILSPAPALAPAPTPIPACTSTLPSTSNTRIVADPMAISNDSERAELGTKCERHVLRDIEEKCREMKTLGLTEDVRELLCTS